MQEKTLIALTEHALHEGCPTMAMLYVAGYAFMLRFPSELLPAVAGGEGEAYRPLAAGAHSCFSVCGGEVVLALAQRKNRPHGSVLR